MREKERVDVHIQTTADVCEDPLCMERISVLFANSGVDVAHALFCPSL